MRFRIWHWAFNLQHDTPCQNQFKPAPFDVEAKDEREAILKAWAGISANKTWILHPPKDHFGNLNQFKNSIRKITKINQSRGRKRG